MGQIDKFNVYSDICPSRLILDRVGDRWTALLVGLLEDRRLRFGELRDLMHITPKVLTETLRALERDGIVKRTEYAETPPRVEYELTELGLTLRGPLAALRQWSQNHADEVIASREQHDGAGIVALEVPLPAEL